MSWRRELDDVQREREGERGREREREREGERERERDLENEDVMDDGFLPQDVLRCEAGGS